MIIRHGEKPAATGPLAAPLFELLESGGHSGYRLTCVGGRGPARSPSCSAAKERVFRSESLAVEFRTIAQTLVVCHSLPGERFFMT